VRVVFWGEVGGPSVVSIGQKNPKQRKKERFKTEQGSLVTRKGNGEMKVAAIANRKRKKTKPDSKKRKVKNEQKKGQQA